MAEVATFRSVLGSLNWLLYTMVVIAVECSLAAQAVPNLKVSDILELNKIVRKLKDLQEFKLTFRRLHGPTVVGAIGD